MNDDTTPISEIKEHLMDFVRAREWEQFHSPKNLSMAIAAEAGELMEHFLWDTSEESMARLKDPERAQAVREELADIVIYALEFANTTGIDLAAAIEEKVAKNGRKYPVEKARGNARKYTEFETE